jgi:hypothetical protein
LPLAVNLAVRQPGHEGCDFLWPYAWTPEEGRTVPTERRLGSHRSQLRHLFLCANYQVQDSLTLCPIVKVIVQNLFHRE